MLIRARAWGFIRVNQLNGRYGVLAGQEAAEGDLTGLLEGTYTLPADAGVELCPVATVLPAQGTFARRSDGSYVHGPITGSDSWTCRLYYFRPGDSAVSEASGSPATINDVGGGSGITLTGANSSQAASSSTGAIGQVHQLAAAACGQAATSGVASAGQVHFLAGSTGSQPASSGGGAITQVHQLVGSASSQAATSSTGSITGDIWLVGSTGSQAAASGAGAITQVHQLVATACAQAAGSGVGAIWLGTAPVFIMPAPQRIWDAPAENRIYEWPA